MPSPARRALVLGLAMQACAAEASPGMAWLQQALECCGGDTAGALLAATAIAAQAARELRRVQMADRVEARLQRYDCCAAPAPDAACA